MNLFTKMFGTHSERELKLIYPLVDRIEALRPEMQKLSDEELKGKTKEFKQRLADGETLLEFFAGRGLRDCPRGCEACAWYGALPGTADWWYYPASGTYRRDEDR